MKVENLTCGHQTVLFEGISFDTASTPLIVIEGENGTGKSTLLNSLLGINSSYQGRVVSDETIGYVPDSSANYFIGMSPRVLFTFIQKQYHLDVSEYADRLMRLRQEFMFDEQLMDTKLAALSLGEKKKVMLIAAFVRNPKLYVMDEPFSGLDDRSLERLYAKIAVLKDNGHQFIIVTHGQDGGLPVVDLRIRLGANK